MVQIKPGCRQFTLSLYKTQDCEFRHFLNKSPRRPLEPRQCDTIIKWNIKNQNSNLIKSKYSAEIMNSVLTKYCPVGLLYNATTLLS